MINYKTKEEIAIMHEGGKRLHKVVEELVPMMKEGVTTNKIDEEAERLIIKNGGSSSFKRVKGYHWNICIPINEQVVHTPPSDRIMKHGDMVTLDIGMFYKGFHTDWATTVVIGGVQDKKVEKFFEVGQTALKKGIAQAKVGNYLGQITEAIEKEVYGNGYFILRDLTGHGVGRDLHEDPYVPNILDKPIDKTIKLKDGLVLAIEVIYSMGTEEIAYEKGNDWSIITADKSLSACFEETVALTNENSFILT